MPLLELVEKKSRESYKKKVSTSVNGEEVLDALWNADFEKIAECYVNGSLNFRIGFPSYHYKATIWHVLANRRDPENIQLLREMLILYKKNITK